MENVILSMLPAREAALLRPCLTSVPLVAGQRLEEPEHDISHIYFPSSGLLTVVASLEDGRQIEIAMIGREGVTGAGVILENHRTPFATYAHIGGAAQRIAAKDLRVCMNESADLRALLLRYMHCFLIQIAQTALANGIGKLEQRTARWLLMVNDRVDHQFLITQDFVAQTLSVRRSSVTEVINVLEAKGLVHSTRGAISIINRRGLEELAGDTYGAAEREYRRLIAEGSSVSA